MWPEIMRTPLSPWPAARPNIEINLADPFSCNGYRRPGGALFTFPAGRPLPRHVVMHVTNELKIISPAYDAGATESGCFAQ
jgi:hypothetical protein